MGGSGVQRPLKFVKYLREFGWNPMILCPQPGAYHTFDESLQNELDRLNLEVHRVEGNTLFHFSGQNKKQVVVQNTLARILRWFSMFFYLPDNKKSWIKPGLEKALKLIEKNEIELVFSSAPPYSNLVLAREIKEKTGLPVVMDLRDDWVESHLIKYPTDWHKNKMKQLEIDTLVKADALLTINERIADSLQSRVLKEVKVIGHGYDPEDFESIPAFMHGSPQKISFLYSGSFYPDSRPDSFLKAIAELIKQKPELGEIIELQFQGGLSSEHWKLINQLNLADLVVDYGYVNHDIAIKNLLKAHVLWLNIGQEKNPQIISLGKTSEYFATKKPILGLVPEGAARDMLLEYGNSFIAEPYNIPDIKKQVITILDKFKTKDWTKPSEEFIQTFDRRVLAKQLSDIFNDFSSH